MVFLPQLQHGLEILLGHAPRTSDEVHDGQRFGVSL